MLILLALALVALVARRFADRATACALAALGVSSTLAASTVGLSLISLLEWRTVLVFWTLLCAGAICLLDDKRRSLRAWVVLAVISATTLLDRAWLGALSLTPWVTAVLLLVGLIAIVRRRGARTWRPWGHNPVAFAASAVLAAATLATALLSVPRVYDVLTYHLPRVVYWLQNQSVAFFPTLEPRHNFTSPFGGYVTAQLLLLHDHDVVALLVQWSALCGTALVAALIVRELGGSRSAEWTAAALTLAIPTSALQASTALADLTNAFFFVLFAWTVLKGVALTRARAAENHIVLWSSAVGAAAALAVLSKATSYLYAVPFGLYWLFYLLRRRPVRRAGAALVAFLMIHGYHYAESCRYYGSPISTANLPTFTIEEPDPAKAIGALAKHVSVHFATPVLEKPLELDLHPSWNERLENAVIALNAAVGLDPDANVMPSGVRYGITRERTSLPQLANSPQSSGSTLHFLLFLFSVPILWRRGRGSLVRALRSTGLRAYCVLAIASFIVFCSFFQWQPWIGRFHLSFLILTVPVAALALESLPLRRLVRTLVVLIAGWTLTLLFVHQESDWSKSVSQPRDALYSQSDLAREIVEQLRGVPAVGLVVPRDFIEYPFLHFFRRLSPETRLFRAFGRIGIDEGRRFGREETDVLVFVTQHRPPVDWLYRAALDRGYRPSFQNAMAHILVRESAP